MLKRLLRHPLTAGLIVTLLYVVASIAVNTDRVDDPLLYASAVVLGLVFAGMASWRRRHGAQRERTA